jgi:DNA polymerase-3 subunit epsilon
MNRIIAFDVETPNSYNDRMSSIGIAVIQDGAIYRTWSTLVNPETHFDAFNIN